MIDTLLYIFACRFFVIKSIVKCYLSFKVQLMCFLYFKVFAFKSLKIKKPGGKVRPARRVDNLAAIY
jgi:hypothetical protein